MCIDTLCRIFNLIISRISSYSDRDAKSYKDKSANWHPLHGQQQTLSWAKFPYAVKPMQTSEHHKDQRIRVITSFTFNQILDDSSV